ncbi:MAG: translation initiation factor IF-1 [Candidatus Dojkabacteria bacterium]
MNDNDKVILEGKVKECLRGTEFLIEIEINGIKKDLIGYISGRMRKAYIKVAYGDRVKIELSKYDLNRGRIIKRL